MMLDGKVAIVTGANGGIGRATVEKLAANGADVWACEYAQTESCDSFCSGLESKYGKSIRPVYFDITDENKVKEAMNSIRKITPQVDILANVAGIVAESSSFSMSSQNKIRKVFEVNYFALSLMTQYVVRIMQRTKRGSIINISSVAAIDGRPGQYEYASSKGAVIGATKELARELWQYGIRVNAIAPGMIDTSMGAKIGEELKNEVLRQTIMGRFGRPEEVANVIAFLGSDLSSYMTGQIIRVDGGM